VWPFGCRVPPVEQVTLRRWVRPTPGPWETDPDVFAVADGAGDFETVQFVSLAGAVERLEREGFGEAAALLTPGASSASSSE